MSRTALKNKTHLVLIYLAVMAHFLGCASPYRGTPSDHFDGKVFFNPGNTKESSVAGYLWLRLTKDRGHWPTKVDLPEIIHALPQRVGAAVGSESQGNDHSEQARVTLIGHATLLIQLNGLNILTDPVWSDRASFLQWIGPKRVSPPSLSIEALPPIDLILISHDHYDHLDTTTLTALHAKDKPRVIVPLGNAELVKSVMPQSVVTEHDWGEKVPFKNAYGSATIHIEPMLHGSGRSPFDQMRTLWAAFVIDAAGYKIYHVGDSGYGEGANFRAAAAKHGAFDLALLPLGAYEPAEFMADSHMSPSDAVKAMRDCNAIQAMGHHHETFQLGFEAYEDSRKDLTAALSKDRFSAPKVGGFVSMTRTKR
jgi:L-ascorbate metabolism protein UlaG (beta-lactamase superfamily)